MFSSRKQHRGEHSVVSLCGRATLRHRTSSLLTSFEDDHTGRDEGKNGETMALVPRPGRRTVMRTSKCVNEVALRLSSRGDVGPTFLPRSLQTRRFRLAATQTPVYSSPLCLVVRHLCSHASSWHAHQNRSRHRAKRAPIARNHRSLRHRSQHFVNQLTYRSILREVLAGLGSHRAKCTARHTNRRPGVLCDRL